MNFLPTHIPQAEEYNAALMVEKIYDLEKAESLREQDLEHLTLQIFSADLRKERLQDIMHTLGTVLVSRKEDEMKERGECLLNAAYAKRQLTEHSLQDTGTSTILMSDEGEDLQNSIIALSRKKRRAEPPEVTGDEPVETENDLEPSGIFSDEKRIIPPQETEPVSHEKKVMEEAAPMTFPVCLSHHLISVNRIKISEAASESNTNFSQYINSKTIDFEVLRREEVFGEIKYLLSTIDHFFRKIAGDPSYEADKTLEMNFKTIQQILQIERKMYQYQEEWLNICEIRTKRLKQFTHLEELEEELQYLEEKPEFEVFLEFMRTSFISSIKEVLHEQRQLPEQIKRIKNDLTELSKKLFSLQITIPGKEREEY